MLDKSKIEILIVDDHAIVRQGIVQLLEQEDNFHVCCEAEDAESALKLVNQYKPDVLIIDITLKGIDGLELTKNICSFHPDIYILILSMHDEGVYAERALRAGANGYIMKQEGTEKLISAINRICSGDIYLSSKMHTTLLSKLTTPAAANQKSGIDILSNRELGVFNLVGRGFGTKKISELLYLSVKTVESHRENIKKKLQLNNAIELVQQAKMWVETESI